MNIFKKKKRFEKHEIKSYIIDPGAEPGFFSGEGAPLRNGVTLHWLQNTSYYKAACHLQGGGGVLNTPEISLYKLQVGNKD